ncbi:unnamed protein product, partial [Amoebophrya sp. A25]
LPRELPRGELRVTVKIFWKKNWYWTSVNTYLCLWSVIIPNKFDESFYPLFFAFMFIHDKKVWNYMHPSTPFIVAVTKT